jgi:hypothetical protein
MDPILKKLIDELSLIEGKHEDWYPQWFKNKKTGQWEQGPPLLTKRGNWKARLRYKIEPTSSPSVATIAGRAAVHGQATYTDREGIQHIVWTTGEGDPSGRSVEGSHPLAMAEKRWLARLTMAALYEMNPELVGVLYDESEADWKAAGFSPIKEEGETSAQVRERHDAPRPQPSSAPPGESGDEPDWVRGLRKEWNDLCGEICEITGLERSAFEQTMYRHLAAFQDDKDPNKWVIPHTKNLPDFATLTQQKRGWALGCKNGPKDGSREGWVVALARLRGGETWELNTFRWSQNRSRWELDSPMVLSPKGGASSPQSDGPGDGFDADDVPF